MPRVKQGRYQRQYIDEHVYEKALERIEYLYRTYDTISIAFSGGKDSTVTMELTIEVARSLGRLPVEILFIDEEAVYTQTAEYVLRLEERDDVYVRWVCIPVTHRNACSREFPFWWPWAPEARARWVRPLPPSKNLITELAGYRASDPSMRMSIPDLAGGFYPPAQYGRIAHLLGLRAQESMHRYWTMLNRKTDNFISPYRHAWSYGNAVNGYPIYDWTTNDVWKYIGDQGLDYNDAYDILKRLGLPPHDQRVAPPYGEEPLQGLFTFKHVSPEMWEKMLRRVPGVSSAVKYADSELYGLQQIPVKPDDISWEAYIARFLNRHPPLIRIQIAKRIKNEINSHYKRTADPLVTNTPHPTTGVSWNMLLEIAIRGDLKGRRNKQRPRSSDASDRQWSAYREERYVYEQTQAKAG